jgi:hypothetical protein
VKHWNYARVKQSIDQMLDSVTATTWGDLANWLGRYLPWEYDYRYDAEHSIAVDITRWDLPDT